MRNNGKFKEEGQQERLVKQKKEARGEAFKGKRFRWKNLDPKKAEEVALGRLVEGQSKTEGELKK